MEAQARTKGVRISTRKVRLVADAIRNMPVTKALAILATTQKRASTTLAKTVKSAAANAVQKGAVEAELVIVRIEVDGGQTLRRMHIGSRSHVRMYTKRSSHIRIVVSDMHDEKKIEKPVEKEEKKVKKAEKSIKQGQDKKGETK
jgi:large subunit ribosomal protein L22